MWIATSTHVSVVFRGNGADLVQEGIGLRPLLGEIGSKDHPGPLFPLELLESIVQGILQLLHLAGLLSAQRITPLSFCSSRNWNTSSRGTE